LSFILFFSLILDFIFLLTNFRAYCEDPVCEPGKTILYKHDCVEYRTVYREQLIVKFEFDEDVEISPEVTKQWFRGEIPVSAEHHKPSTGKPEKSIVFVKFNREIRKY